MKTHCKAVSALLGSSALLVTTPALAQFAFPTVTLNAVGEGSDMNVKVQKCIGVDGVLGKNDGTTQTIVAADFSGVPPLLCSAGDPLNNVYDVSSNTYTGNYVDTGSGFARQHYRNFNGFNVTGATTNQNPLAPYTSAPGNPVITGGWTNLQYALSETPLSVPDIADYNVNDPEFATVNGVPGVDIDDSALANAGPAIQIPLYVVPIAFAYSPQYGVNTVGQQMNFNVKFPTFSGSVATGGLRLKKATYCDIWNGNITNWNHPAIQLLNGNQPLFDPLTDFATRWAAEGAPIRLIGRADRSGDTWIFTKALAAQCASTPGNKFLQSAESLPYDPSTGIDIRPLRGGSAYFPASLPSNFAGTANSLGGFVFDKFGQSCFYNTVSSGVCTTPAVANTPGLFSVANGSADVERAIRIATSTTLLTLSSGVQINGKFGYISADFVSATPGRALFSVALQIGSGAGYAMPTAGTASAAIGTIAPPQPAFPAADARVIWADLSNIATGLSVNPALLQNPVRQNPLNWVNVLYPAPYNIAGNLVPQPPTLANPGAGYPVTGTLNMLTYTCFSTIDKKHGIANMLVSVMGQLPQRNSGTPLSAATFPGPSNLTPGIVRQANIAVIPAAWRTAINRTFLQRYTPGGLGALNLWIQSAQPATLAQFATVNEGAGGSPADNRNPQCVVGGVADNVSPSLPGA